ncbi:MAG TPA: class I tRNA ligase family protein [Planctomycetota bacterium]|nr:class I tRNA ligase family protein [Planctomycetota bacterium]
MDTKDKYPFAEVEAKWQGVLERAPRPGPVAGGLGPPERSYIFPWPISPELELGPSPGTTGSLRGASVARRLAMADTIRRFEGHRGGAPFLPIVIDGFAAGPSEAARRRIGEERDVSAGARDCLGGLLRLLGLEAGEDLIDTGSPRYYRFTQWIFLQIFLRGFARRAEKRVDSCTRCGRHVRLGSEASCPGCQGELKEQTVPEWQVDVRQHGGRLIDDLSDKGICDWSEADRSVQEDLLGRCEGHEVAFPASRIFDDEYHELTVFTTQVERIFGAMFLLVEPHHAILEHVLDPAYEDDIVRYRERLRKGAEPRISAVRTGGFALNPATLRRIPILVSPLASTPYSHGVLMCVPAHDRILFELARRLKLPIREVIHNDRARFDSQSRLEEPWLGDGVLTNSGPFTSLPSKVGCDRIVALLGKKGACKKVTRFRVEKLALSSACAWGPPVPMIHCVRCGVVPVPEEELPVELPAGVSTKRPAAPSGAGTGVEPEGLGAVKSFLRAPCPLCGESASRDTHTILPWLGTAWSYLRAAFPELAGDVDGFPGTARVTRDPAPGGRGTEHARSARGDRENGGSADGAEGAGDDDGAMARAGEGGSGAPLEGPAERSGALAGAAPLLAEPEVDQVLLPEDIDVFGVSGPSAKSERAPAVSADDDALSLDARIAAEDAPAGEGDAGMGAAPQPSRSPEAAPSTRVHAAGAHGEVEAVPATMAHEDSASEAPGEEARVNPEDDEDEDDADLAAAEKAAFERLSKRKPFQSPAGLSLLPADFAFGAESNRALDLVSVRFLTKLLGDLGHISIREPFERYLHVGGAAWAGRPPRHADAAAIPKDLPPESLVELMDLFGADAVRLALLAGGPPSSGIRLDVRVLRSMQRLLDRIWRQMSLRRERGKFVSRHMLVRKHFLIHDVTERLAHGKFHTAFAALSAFVSFLEEEETTPEDMDRYAMRTFILLLSPFAPSLALELWSLMGETEDLAAAAWPMASDELLHPPEREFLILVDGKVKDRMQQPSQLEPEKLESRALQRDAIREIVAARKVKRVVVVPGKLVSIALESERAG